SFGALFMGGLTDMRDFGIGVAREVLEPAHIIHDFYQAVAEQVAETLGHPPYQPPLFSRVGRNAWENPHRPAWELIWKAKLDHARDSAITLVGFGILRGFRTALAG